jgi:hypothetical protein
MAPVDAGLAGAAGAVAASVWNDEASRECGFENGLICFDGELLSAGLE